MQLRHGTRADAAAEAVAHHEVVSFLHLTDKRRNRRPIVGVISVGHHDDVASGFADPTHQGRSIAFAPFVDHSGTELLRNLDGSVGRAVVSDYDLASNSELRETAKRFLDTDRNRLLLVETRNHGRHDGCRL